LKIKGKEAFFFPFKKKRSKAQEKEKIFFSLRRVLWAFCGGSNPFFAS